MAYAREKRCKECDGQGLIRIRYKSHEPDDCAICDCRRGQWFRAGGEGLVRQHLTLPATMRVAVLEAFAEPEQAQAARAAEASQKLARNEW